jgi:hypothetical protein
MSNDGAALGAAVPAPGARTRAATPVSNARAEASRRNGAQSRGPKSAVGKARAAQNALKHGMRSLKYVVLPDESPAEFHALEEAMVDELAPVGALQTVLARRIAVAAWRLARADQLAAETGLGPRFPTRRPTGRAVRGAALGGRRGRHGPDPRRQRHPQLRDALIGASTELGDRCAPTNRYRSAAMAEFMRALKTLKALQAEQADMIEQATADRALATPVVRLAAPAPVRARPSRPAARPAKPRRPNEPEPFMAYLLPDLPMAGPALHESPAPAPNEPDSVSQPASNRDQRQLSVLMPPNEEAARVMKRSRLPVW